RAAGPGAGPGLRQPVRRGGPPLRHRAPPQRGRFPVRLRQLRPHRRAGPRGRLDLDPRARGSLGDVMHLCLALLWSLSAAQAPPPPPAPLPPAKQILDRYVEVTGGRAAYEKGKHRTLTGTFELKGMGMKGSLLLQQSAPDKMRTQIDVPGVGSIVKGTDGIQAWEVSAVTGPRLLEGTEKSEALLEAA